jgi:predicted dehydrogenase
MQLEPVPTAFVGLGSRGMRYLRAAHWVGGFAPVALIDTDAEKFTEPRSFTELPESACHSLLADALQAHEIAAVFVCAPPSAHAAIILEAVTAGAHVFTETPFTTKYTDAVEAVEVAAASDIAIVVAQQYRLAAVERTIAKLLAQGAFGGVGFGYLRHDLPTPEPAVADGISRLWRVDVHTIDSLVAMMPGRPARVFGRLFSPGFSDAGEPSSLQATFEFDDGAVVQYFSSFETYQPAYRFRLDCEAATLVHRALHPGRGDDAPELIQIAPDGSRQSVTLDTSYDDAWLEETLAIFFKDYFRDGKEPATSGRNNLVTMAVLHALLRSSETGQAVDVAEVAPEAFRERD